MNLGKLLISLVLVSLLLNMAIPMAVAESTGKALDQREEPLDPSEYVPGELLIKFVDGVEPATIHRVAQNVNAQNIKTFSEIGVQHWRLGNGLSVEQALKRFSNPAFRDVIEYAEPNYIYHASTFPNDHLRGELYGMHNFGQTGGTLDADIDALEAWDSGYTGSSSVVVGVIDTGIDYNHEDLAGNIWTNPNEIPDNEIDDDGNGYVDDVRGWDCVNDDNDPIDDNGHGTHCAGTIGAMGDNGIGVTGVAWDVQLMPIKFLDVGGYGSNDDAIEAVLYAASFEDESGNKIVRITSNSWGGGRRSKALENAIKDSGALFIAASGNCGSSQKSLPAGYALDNIISVAATDHNDKLASFSNYGSDWVDLGAPGVDILSTIPEDSYGTESGTSMAAPHVSGVAALLMAHNPSLTNAEVKDQILNTVDLLPSLDGMVLTGGRLNARAALGAQELPEDTTAPDAVTDLAVDMSEITQVSVKLTWTAPGDDGSSGTAYLYEVRYTSLSLQYTPSNPLSGFDAMDKTGDWTITVTDSVSADDGTFNAWGLHITTGSGLCVYETGYLGIPISYYDPDGVSHTINVPESETILDVDVYLDISHSWVGDLTVWVEHGGTEIIVIDRPGAGGCSANNYAGIILNDEGTGGAIEDICKNNLWSIGRPTGEPIPQVANSIETFTVTGLHPGMTYDFCMRTADEMGNYASFSNVVSATTEASAWDIDIVESRAGIGNYVSLAYDPLGNPALGYTDDDNDRVKFAHWNGASWDVEDVDEGNQVHLAYDPTDGYPSLSYGKGNLKFAHWNGASWDIDVVMDKGGTSHSLAYDPIINVPTISFAHKEGRGKKVTYTLKFARYNPGSGSWNIEVVDDQDIPQYNSLAYDLTGNPAIAYSGSLSGEWRDCLKLARWNGASWDIEFVEENVLGVGDTPTLDFDPFTGYPSISHTFCGGVRFSSWDGISWVTEVIYEVQACPIAAFSYSPNGIPFVSFIFGAGYYVAQKSGTAWEYEIADEGPGGSYRFSLKFNSSGNPSLGYVNNPDVKYAIKP